MKTKYFYFFFAQSGVVDISLWRELSDEEANGLISEHDSLTEAAMVDHSDSDLFWILSEPELVSLKILLNKALGQSRSGYAIN